MAEKFQPDKPNLKRVILKGLLLFLVIDILFAVIKPLPSIAKLSAYNLLFPGRVRLPYGDKPNQAYNLSLYSLEAMFASHELAGGKKPSDEYRVFLIGDSSVWGFLLKPENTLSAYINSANLQTTDHRRVRAYNLGYPTLSVIKDLLILDYARRYQPDLIVWLVTLESLPVSKQMDSPIVQNNAEQIRNLISKYSLNLAIDDSRLIDQGFLDKTLVGQRRSLADLLRLQLYGLMWASTWIDQYYPETYEPPQSDLEADETFHGLKPPELNPSDLSLDVLSAGISITGDVPVLLVNEPIYLSQGKNSEVRYNFFYPRWAYDQYRSLLTKTCQTNGWHCLDEWSIVPADQFTNSAIHMSPAGTQLLANQIGKAVLALQP